MASIVRDVLIDARPGEIWAALRDFGALHRRLMPGFVVDCHLEDPDTRTITFFNGAVAREVLIGVDDASCRLAYSVVEGPMGFTHHSASAQVLADGDGARFVWTTDLLPDEAAPRTAELMEHGIKVIKQTMEVRDTAQSAS